MRYQKNSLAVRFHAIVMKFAVRLQTLPLNMMPPPIRLMQLGSAFWQSRVLYVAVRLDIATVLGDDRLSAERIAAEVGAEPAAVGRLLRMLAANGTFEQCGPETFRNNKASDCLRGDRPGNTRAMVLMHNAPPISRPWYERLEDGVRSGKPPFELAHGMEFFDYLDSHGEFADLFAEAMDCVEQLSGDSFAKDFDWGKFERIVDIGGSKGSKALAILKRHPRLEALVIDSEPVIRLGERFWQGKVEQQVLARLSFQVGDMFDRLPRAEGDKDLYLLSAVLHGYSDRECVRALRNIVRALDGSGARIAVLEMVLDDTAVDLTGTMLDMQMFVCTRGRERTFADWQTVFRRSGLQLEDVVGLRTFGKIMVLKEPDGN